MAQEIIFHFKTGNPLRFWITEEEFESKEATDDAILRECENLEDTYVEDIIRVEIGEHNEE